MVLCCVRVMAGKHVDLNAIENYLRHKKYPDGTSAKGDKARFRRACKKFNLVNGQMMYKGNRFVISMNRVEEIHDSVKAVALSSHLGRTSTYQKITTRFYWYTTVDDVAEYIKSCTKCQRHPAMPNNVKQELKSIPVLSNVMNQIGVDLCPLPKVDEFACRC